MAYERALRERSIGEGPTEKVMASASLSGSARHRAPNGLKERSGSRVIRSAVTIKAWLEQTPSVDAVRPCHCVACQTASRPVGACLAVHGQGVVRRQARGLLEEDGEPGVWEITARKYECQRCGAVMTVLPRGMLAGRQYTGSSIALSLWLWLVLGLPDVVVRARVCAWRVSGQSGARGWAQLYRWVRDAGRLFVLPRPIGSTQSARQAAVAAVMMLRALAPPTSTSESAQVFAGALSS